MASNFSERLGPLRSRLPIASDDSDRADADTPDTGTPAEVEEDAAALLGLSATRDRPLRVSVVVDDDGLEQHRDLVRALSRHSRLMVHMPAGSQRRIEEMRTHEFEDIRGLDDLLVARPPRDLVLDLRRASAIEQLALWRRAYFHVLDGGVHIHVRPTPPDLPGWSQRVAARANRQRFRGPVFRDLTASTRRVRTLSLHSGDFIAYKKSRRHLYRIRDRDAGELVPRRAPGLAVDLLASVPETSLRSRATVRHHGASIPLTGFDETLEVPTLHAWHYRGGLTVDSHMLAYRGASVLPPSFRFPEQRALHNRRLRPVGSHWAHLGPTVEKPATVLEGNYFDLNSGYPGMFGHFMTQSIHKLWAWDRAKEQMPDLKALYYVREGRDASTERQVFEAYGIDPRDLYLFSEPVHVGSYVSPTIAWDYQAPCYASPLALDTWQRIARGLGAPASGEGDRMLFISRHAGISSRRPCRNTGQVEELFAEHGFDIVYPEEHSVGEQAAMFAEAGVVAGFGGSAMFNLMYSAPKHVIVLNQEAYRVRSEHLYTALLGCEVDYFWSTPDIRQTDDAAPGEAFASPWEFDFERNGAELTDLLTDIARGGARR